MQKINCTSKADESIISYVASALEGAGVDKDQLTVGNTLILTGVGVIFQFDHND